MSNNVIDFPALLVLRTLQQVKHVTHLEGEMAVNRALEKGYVLLSAAQIGDDVVGSTRSYVVGWTRDDDPPSLVRDISHLNI